MRRFFTVFALVLLVFAGQAPAQPEGILKGKVKKIDLGRPSITLIFNGNEREFFLSSDMQVICDRDGEGRQRTAEVF